MPFLESKLEAGDEVAARDGHAHRRPLMRACATGDGDDGQRTAQSGFAKHIDHGCADTGGVQNKRTTAGIRIAVGKGANVVSNAGIGRAQGDALDAAHDQLRGVKRLRSLKANALRVAWVLALNDHAGWLSAKIGSRKMQYFGTNRT